MSSAGPAPASTSGPIESTAPPAEPAAPGPPTGAWVPPPAPVPPARRTLLIGAIAVAVAVALVLVALIATGVIPVLKANSSSTPASATFRQARAASDAKAASFGGGGWVLVAAAGIAISNSLTIPLGGFSNSSRYNCTYQNLGFLNFNSSLTVPGTSGGVGTGQAGFWGFLYHNVIGTGLIVAVSGGTASLVASIASTCIFARVLAFINAIPSTVIDSPQAAQVAGSAGGTAFLAAHAGSTVGYELFGGASIGARVPVGSQWQVVYTNCTPSTVAHSSALFNATINGTQGTLLATSNSTGFCGALPTGGGAATPLGASFAMSPPAESTNSANHWYNFSIAAAGGGLLLDNLAFEVLSGTTVVPSGSFTLGVIGLSGPPAIASFDFASGTWTSGGNFAVTTQMVLSLNSGTASLSSDEFVAIGMGSFSGQVVLSIP